MLPLVSIIIPVYNVEKYLETCVSTVIHQTYQNIEIILVDDGSTDLSGKICDDFAKNDGRVMVIHKENRGLSDARNTGIEASRGAFLAFIDSDDYVSEYYIEAMMNPLIHDKVKISALVHAEEFWDGEILPVLALSAQDNIIKIQNVKKVLMRMLYCDVTIGAQFKIYRRDIFESIQFPVGYLYEDLATTYKTFIKCRRIAVVDGNLYAYRKRKDSLIRSNFSDKKMVIISLAEQLIQDVKAYDIRLEQAAISRAFSAVFSVFLQVPFEDKTNRIRLWNFIIKNRKKVLLDNNALIRKKNRYAALISYMGMDISWLIGRKFGRKGTFQ